MHMHFDSSLKGYNAHVKFIVHTSRDSKSGSDIFPLLFAFSVDFEGAAVHRLLRDRTIFNLSLKS